MANVAHKNLTGVNLHEPKGLAAVATAGKVYTSDGAGSGSWQTPASPGIVWLAGATISTAATCDFVTGVTPTGSGITGTGTALFDNTYDSYQFILNNIKPATDDVDLYMRVGTGGTPTYQTSGYNYSTTLQGTAFVASAAAQIFMTGRSSGAGAGIGNASGENLSGTVNFSNPEVATDFVEFMYHLGYSGAAAPSSQKIHGVGKWTTVGAITAVRFFMASGNLASGTINMYGYKKS